MLKNKFFNQKFQAFRSNWMTEIWLRQNAQNFHSLRKESVSA